MRYIVTERQLKLISEQSMSGAMRYVPQDQRMNVVKGMDEKMTSHNLSNILGLASFFIPVIGPIISAGISLGDSAKYWQEGDKKTAALTAIFPFLPLGKLGNLVPGTKKLGKEGMEELGKKIGKGSKDFSQVDYDVIEGFSKYKDVLNQEMKRISDDLLKNSKQTISELPLGNLGKNFKEYARTYKGRGKDGKLNGWDWIEPISTVGNSSGWKFHIFSADLNDVAYLYENLLPVVQKYGAGFKVASLSTLASLSKGGTQFGKGAVIYIPSDVIKKGNLNNFLSEIKSAISGYKVKGNVFGDRMIDDRIGYRYEFNKPVNPSKGLPSSTGSYRTNDGNYNIPGNPDLFR